MILKSDKGVYILGTKAVYEKGLKGKEITYVL